MKLSSLAILLLSASAALPADAATKDDFTTGAEGVRIHYLEAGAVSAPHTLLLVPGWRISVVIWSKQLEYFSAHGYRVVAIDSRSQGASSIRSSHNAPEDRAADIQQVIANLQLTHLVLVGWSQGSQDVAAYVQRFGTTAVERFVLVDSPVSGGPGDFTDKPALIKAIVQGMAMYAHDPRAFSDGMMQRIISAPHSAQMYARLTQASLLTPADTGISMQVQDFFTTDRRPTLAAFEKPVLVVASAESPLLEAQKSMAAAVPHGQFVSIEHAAHAVFFDQPDEFNRRLDEFVTGRGR
jgi:non-heme chloroperoxidase